MSVHSKVLKCERSRLTLAKITSFPCRCSQANFRNFGSINSSPHQKGRKLLPPSSPFFPISSSCFMKEVRKFLDVFPFAHCVPQSCCGTPNAWRTEQQAAAALGAVKLSGKCSTCPEVPWFRPELCGNGFCLQNQRSLRTGCHPEKRAARLHCQPAPQMLLALLLPLEVT